MKPINIITPNIFSFEQCLSYLSRADNEVLFQVEDGHIKRAIKLEKERYLIDIFHEDDYLKVNILNHEYIDMFSENQIINYIREWFDMDEDLNVFYNFAQSDAMLKDVVQDFYGLRLMRVPDFYEAIVWGILGQQINLTFAYQLKRNLVEQYGDYIIYEGKKYYIHPDPKDIMNLTIDELMTLKMTRRKSEYLRDISRKLHENEISKEYYMNYGNAVTTEKQLIKLRGIGPWTANYVMMRALGLKDAFPMGDVGLQNGIKFINNMEEKPSSEELQTLRTKWYKHCAYATFYIWRVLY